MKLKDCTVLITGGTGSFGSAMVDILLQNDIKEIRIISRDELKQDNMRHKYNDNRLKFYIADVRDFDSIEKHFIGVDYVFHAAALKQVPSCEFFPMEAVKTNIIGSNNVIDACLKHDIAKVVFLSTDKACYPINAMGMSKALMERNVIARSTMHKKKTILCCTRYGNVMCSRGSVIPLFLDQIGQNKPITITNPGMTRFMMSLDDACKLVLFAFENAKQGDLFIQKSGASTIKELADALFILMGKNTGIKIIGTRHGEKVFESLATTEELTKAIDMGDYYRIPKDERDLNYEKYFTDGTQNIVSDSYNSHNTNRLTQKQLIEKLTEITYIKEKLNAK